MHRLRVGAELRGERLEVEPLIVIAARVLAEGRHSHLFGDQSTERPAASHQRRPKTWSIVTLTARRTASATAWSEPSAPRCGRHTGHGIPAPHSQPSGVHGLSGCHSQISMAPLQRGQLIAGPHYGPSRICAHGRAEIVCRLRQHFPDLRVVFGEGEAKK